MSGLVQKFAGVSSNGSNGVCDDYVDISTDYEQ